MAVIIVVVLLILGLLAYIMAQWPFAVQSGKNKHKKERPLPAEPSKDVSLVVERFERRIRTLENALQAAQADQKERLARIEELEVLNNGLEQQVRQEKAWREKEEAFVAKERRLEQELRADLDHTRTLLHEESNRRIRLEYELKEACLLKDATAADVRKLTGQHNELSRQLQELEVEARGLRSENARLKIKKEADAWVAKEDYVKLEKLLKHARRELERLPGECGLAHAPAKT